MTSTDLKERGTIIVENEDGRKIEVHGRVIVTHECTVRSTDPGINHSGPVISPGRSPAEVEAVTHWVAEKLADEFDIDVKKYGIKVIDPTSDEYTVL